MEFRLFLPLLCPSDNALLSDEEIVAYEILVGRIQHLNITQVREARRDVYIVGGSHFGIKYRGEETLEIKIRQGGLDASHLFIETWKKKVYKKGVKIVSCKNDILQILASYGHSENSEVDKALIEMEIQADVSKVRCATLVGDVAQEVCYLEIAESSSLVCKRNRSWLSVSVEGGNMDEIRDFLSTEFGLRDVWKAMYVLRDAATTNRRAFLEKGLVPVIGGYPTWIRYIGNTVDLEEFDECLQRVGILFDFIVDSK